MNLAEQIKEAEKMRADWSASDAGRDAGLVARDDVSCISDITYTESETEDEKIWHLTDIYYPKAADVTSYPVIVSVHGGGWFYGDKKLYSHYCMKLASYGYAVVNFNYRLSPVYKYPCGFMDVCRLMSFLADRADEYKLDMSSLFGVGDSAGAQLLSQYSIWATNPEYRALTGDYGISNAPIPKRVALNCGIYDMRDMEGRDIIVEMYLEGKPEDYPDFLNVIDYVTSDFPETYLMLSVNDDLREHTIPMKKKLEEQGVNFVFRELGAGVPSDGHVFHINMRSDNGIKCNDEEIAFFRGEI